MERRSAVTTDSGVRGSHGVQLYLDLMKQVLTNVIYQDDAYNYAQFTRPNEPAESEKSTPKGGMGSQVFAHNQKARETGMDWPRMAHTMVGRSRLDNVHACLDRILADDVPGDLIETGVWRGGVCIFMRAFLAAHVRTDRTVWLADSFEGLPEPTPEDMLPEGEGRIDVPSVNHHVLGVELPKVQENFRRYNLLDEQVRFLPGWFSDSLPTAPIERLALLRLDGDWYKSTMDALVNLYPKLSLGGFAIIDDYMLPGCRQAVTDYREKHSIDEPIEVIDETGVFWRKTDTGASEHAALN